MISFITQIVTEIFHKAALLKKAAVAATTGALQVGT